MTNRILIGLILLLSTISCRKTSSTTGTGSTGSGTVSVKITDTKGSSTVTVKPSSLLGFFWTGGNGTTANDLPGFHAVNSDQVVFALNFEAQVKSYTRTGTTLDRKDRDFFVLSYQSVSNSFYSKDGTLNITKIVTGFDSVSSRKTYTITANWSGTLFDSTRNRTVNGVITWNSAKFE